MKRKGLILLIAVMLLASMPICALASTLRSIAIVPGLKFTETTANCTVFVGGNDPYDEIEVEVKLWRGNTCLKTWTESGLGYLTFSDTWRVSRNYDYTLTATVKINGILQNPVSISKRCE